MRRWLVVVLGIILVLIGAVWTLQGANYLGGSFMAYPAGSVSEVGGPGGVGSVSSHTFLYGAEMGYSIKPIDLLTIRPQLGFGDTSPSSGPVTITFWYLQPAVAALVDLFAGPVGEAGVGDRVAADAVGDGLQHRGAALLTRLLEQPGSGRLDLV